MVQALILSLLDVGSILISDPTDTTLAPVKNALHAGAWLTKCLKKLNYINPTLKDLHHLPLIAQINVILAASLIKISTPRPQLT